MVKNVFKKLGKKQKNNKGFSLVELIVVIAIMAVLVGVLAPQLIKYVEKSREATDIQNCDSIATALKTYYSDVENATDVTIDVTTTETTSTEKALVDAGLEKLKLKASGWNGNKITIKYVASTGKVQYNAKSNYYSATNAGEIKSVKGSASGSGTGTGSGTGSGS